MRLLRAATLAVSDPHASAALYARWLDYAVVEDGPIPPDLADCWGAPALSGKRQVVMRPASGLPIFLRFVEQAATPGYAPLRTYGWNAIEICIQDVAAVNARMEQSPFEIIGPPKPLEGVPGIFPMQVKGPVDSEIVYLTQIDPIPEPVGLPKAQSLIDCLFILVMGCSDMAASERWMRETLRLDAGSTWTIPYTMIADAYGLPRDSLHTICTVTHQGDSFFELDQYPDAAAARPAPEGGLPAGISMGSILTPDFDAIDAAAPGWIRPPSRLPGPVYAGGRSGVLRGPDGTLIEVIEIPA
jgi:catechol 2,3-dioxygenase-like lactoylglutathione lyase family enzyme